jgi:hypothetical protein
MKLRPAFKRKNKLLSSDEHTHRRLIRLDSRIRNQFDLITSRTGWLLTSQAFLLTAFAALLNALADKDFNEISFDFYFIQVFIFVIIPVLGFALCIMINTSITAAYSAIDTLKNHRIQLLSEASNKYRYENTEPSSDVTKAGDRPPKFFPIILALLWLTLLLLVVFALSKYYLIFI